MSQWIGRASFLKKLDMNVTRAAFEIARHRETFKRKRHAKLIEKNEIADFEMYIEVTSLINHSCIK